MLTIGRDRFRFVTRLGFRKIARFRTRVHENLRKIMKAKSPLTSIFALFVVVFLGFQPKGWVDL
jgi:hypothetical protein